MKKEILFIYFSLYLLSACSHNESSSKTPFQEKANNEKDTLRSGEVLFTTQCKVCHSIEPGADEILGPNLHRAIKNWKDENELIRFIKNAPENLNLNEHTRELYGKWKGTTQMPPFTGLSTEDIRKIIRFLKREESP